MVRPLLVRTRNPLSDLVIGDDDQSDEPREQ
jgi:hypothetical protein